jgi:hypothetical protein
MGNFRCCMRMTALEDLCGGIGLGAKYLADPRFHSVIGVIKFVV